MIRGWDAVGKHSLEVSVEVRPDCLRPRLLRHIPRPVMLSDMPRSLCVLGHAGSGKEESSARRQRHRQRERDN